MPRDACSAPLRVLARELLEHPVADRLDQPHLLGERDELAGRHQAAVRLLPSHQRLDRMHGRRPRGRRSVGSAGPSSVGDGLTQPRRRTRAGAPGRRRRRRSTTYPPASDPLTRYIAASALLQERLGVARVLRIQADADRRRHEELAARRGRTAARSASRTRAATDSATRAAASAAGRALAPLEVGQQEQELVARPARDEVGLARAAAQALGQLRSAAGRRRHGRASRSRA